MLAISPMGNTVTFVFLAAGIALWVLATLGQSIFGSKFALGWLGLAAFFFPQFWTSLANL